MCKVNVDRDMRRYDRNGKDALTLMEFTQAVRELCARPPPATARHAHPLAHVRTQARPHASTPTREHAHTHAAACLDTPRCARHGTQA